MAYFWVFFGSGLGGMCRFALARWFNTGHVYPWGTLLANGLSCVALGALVALAARDQLSGEARLLLITGFCGGFSTFSTFSNELMQMLRGQAYGAALAYLMMSLCFGLLAIWVGMRLGE